MVLKKFEQDPLLRQKYEAVEPYFVSTVLCVNSGACDERTTIELLKDDILGFYNAVCAYTSGDQGSKKDSQLLISFLVKQAGIAVSPDNYFCPEEAEKLLNEQ
jgi:hypothetical protein